MSIEDLPLPVRGVLSGWITYLKKHPIYGNGEKYCGRCGIVVKGNFNRCPYCGGMLRFKPKGKRDKRFKPRVDPLKYGVDPEEI